MSKPVLWIVGGVIGLGLIVLLAASIASEQPIDPSVAFGEVEVDGDPLPVLGDQGDVAIGFDAATVTGADWNGIEHKIEADGRPKIVIFLAHWCQFCQAEVPVVQDWIDAGNLPDDVDMYSVTVLSDHLTPNWPPQEWLEDEGWTVPVIMDDEANSVAIAYGMRGTPFYIVLDGDNVNLQRVSGEIGIPGLNALVDIAQASN
jgi:thiol-disulfide isomerase/thioredoxin